MRLWRIGRRLGPANVYPGADRPDWQQADPRLIERAVAHAQAKSGGGWYVLDASRAVTGEPRRYRVAGRDVVAWRARGRPLVAPDVCPHMGASLACGRVDDGELVCPWHGLRLGPRGHGRWRPYPTHDDGVLVWARMAQDETASDVPVLPRRPSLARSLAGVVRMEGACEPVDVIANRLDPWHGVHYHPHSFAALEMIEAREDVMKLRVAYRVAGPVCVEVDCTFHCPDPRTIVMTIVDGDGAGSVVETHATPVDEGRTAMIEATIASSDRRGFALARRAQPLLRPFVEARARRLWREDLAYAERRYALRQGRVTTQSEPYDQPAHAGTSP
ncbi:MAG: DUF5914 domain-containing protein [Polyangiales bacterium]